MKDSLDTKQLETAQEKSLSQRILKNQKARRTMTEKTEQNIQEP